MNEKKECKMCEICPKSAKTIPFIVHEAARDRASRQSRTLVIALIIAISLIVITNAAWICVCR